MKLENQPKGQRPLMPPLILGNLISYRGFKELAFVASNSDIVYAIDADLGKMFWQKHLEYASLDPPAAASSVACPGGLTAMPTMPPPAAGRGGAARGVPGAVPAGRGAAGHPVTAGAAGAPAARGPAGLPRATGARGGAQGGPARGPFEAFGAASVYVISSDGRLHKLNTSTGDDQVQPVKVLTSNATAYSLNMADNVIYTVTGHDCNGVANAVWAVDLIPDPPKSTSFTLGAGDGGGLGGPAIGADGTVYVQTADRLLALSPRDLKLKQSFSLASNLSNSPSPLVIPYKERDLIVAAGKDGHLYLLDSASLSAALYETPVAAGIWGNLSTWQDADGMRWVLAPVWGPLSAEFKSPVVNGSTPNGSIVAFKVEEQNGKPVLTPAWVSRDISSPEPPVIASGVVFALSSGDFAGRRSLGGSHATLYALDAAMGKELYSSRNLVNAPAALTGITLANGRVYFGTTDGTAYAFGMYVEH
jgi:outer membrane protein assembly factor BamB